MRTPRSDPPISVPAFHPGQLLSAKDMNDLARWAQGKFKRASCRHGWGITHGLRLQLEADHALGTPMEPGEDQFVAASQKRRPTVFIVTDGSAIDAYGRELLWVGDNRPLPLADLFKRSCVEPPDPGDEAVFVVWLQWEADEVKRRYPYLRVIIRDDLLQSSSQEVPESTPPDDDPGKTVLLLKIPKPEETQVYEDFVEAFRRAAEPEAPPQPEAKPSASPISQSGDLPTRREETNSPSAPNGAQTHESGGENIAAIQQRRLLVLENFLSQPVDFPDGVPLGRIWVEGSADNPRIIAVDNASERRLFSPVFPPAPSGAVNSAILVNQTTETAAALLGLHGIKVVETKEWEDQQPLHWYVWLEPRTHVELLVANVEPYDKNRVVGVRIVEDPLLVIRRRLEQLAVEMETQFQKFRKRFDALDAAVEKIHERLERLAKQINLLRFKTFVQFIVAAFIGGGFFIFVFNSLKGTFSSPFVSLGLVGLLLLAGFIGWGIWKKAK